MTEQDFLKYLSNYYGETVDNLKQFTQCKFSGEELFEFVSEYASQSKWVSVEERLPEFGETVLVYCKIYGRFLATYEYIGEFGGEKYGNWRDFKGNLGILPPVWWMKIDEPPVEKP